MLATKSPPDLVIETTEIPKMALQLLSGKMEGVERTAGIFTKEDLINIKLYVRAGLALPTQLTTVESYLGYKNSGIAGLEPIDILQQYISINSHALTWNNLEGHVLKQSIVLDTVANNIVGTGNEIIAIINQMPILERVKQTVGDISEEELREITYTSEDREVAGALQEILAQMRIDIAKQQSDTNAVKTAVSDFRIKIVGGTLNNREITQGLEPQIKFKYDLMRKSGLLTTIKNLQEQIDEKNLEIEQLKKDYSKYVALAFSGVALIPVIITGSIFGDKAEKARKAKNRLIIEVKELQNQVAEKKALQAALENLTGIFSDLGIRMLDAESALNHLDYVWANLLSHIDASNQEMENINDALKLTSFIVNFKKVINPWGSVGGMAQDLVISINEALEEYKRLYQ
ncbi:alpha-xenorhabdolysin family binary toxin subunit A [Collimonas antrihumi]|uniref:alpha-xenorhabdolysin family binary toxin subunit A n=1 Tax=Collimonas antrihumi TaxID=1940615 RepID=UPI002484BBB9|nr:alpha-xenorhabdolysin family binary toxin subunit A [Collimonas antrihumi]